MRLEEGVLQRRGAGDGEVGPLLEVLAMRLRRRRQRQPEMLGCKLIKDPISKSETYTAYNVMFANKGT